MKKIIPLFLLFAFLPLAADETIYTVKLLPGDTHCNNGGAAVFTGEDLNSDGKLEEGVDAITSSTYICNGDNGCKLIASVGVPTTSYPQCYPNNGVSIKSGVDCNLNGEIDDGKETEIILCYGAKGADGTNGTASIAVADAAEGSNGSDGKASEFVVTEEPAGENCAEGGLKVETRFDSDGSGIVEDSEVSVKYVCNGERPQGSKGEQGDQGIAGMDGKDGADGAKGERGDKGEPGEPGVAGEKGEAGSDGFDSLVSVIDEPAGNNCEDGGKKFMSGVDSDRNGILDESEVKNSYYICNGEDAEEASEQAVSSGCSLTVF
jgi:Collagen triple helix repeat (20 copies).